MYQVYALKYAERDIAACNFFFREASHDPVTLHYYVWLLNNNLAYFFNSPVPFLKAAMMLPIVARHSGQTFWQTLRQLKKFPAKSLVCLAFPFSLLLNAIDMRDTLVGR